MEIAASSDLVQQAYKRYLNPPLYEMYDLHNDPYEFRTGRHPYRYGIPWAGAGHLPGEEITIAEALKLAGYATGHFGKWHVGELSKTVNQSYFPGKVNPTNYSPPWLSGFDECFSTESMMPTYNLYFHDGGKYGEEDYQYIMDRPVKEGAMTGHRWRDHY